MNRHLSTSFLTKSWAGVIILCEYWDLKKYSEARVVNHQRQRMNPLPLMMVVSLGLNKDETL